ncbi:MAG: DUF4907 domain-containing protein [Bacteroidales bacterium]|jgi:hypothetical protein|nr:DUF4907 domain-containing protein [Bacteroidales bacterium]MDD2204605.1 DUF4907 domain-containing protein [Bacteroidales bacterium]MDD3151292.1 DUF4907 domain-containing protein [Bacteroidales bacterium]MDD3914364.1 DUF4907 domain-containing protein [Bacteroidales bacterium]MDD4633458.1 DUF4907 domain-containing protein [Bacteroidales bacterium]
MKKNIIIIILLVIIIVLAFFLWKAKTNNMEKAIQNTEIQLQDTVSSSVVNPYQNTDVTTNIISSEDNTFGYDILINGQILVHQPSIPGLPGNKGFDTEQQAQRVANFVATKVKNNEMPPTVTNEDLNELLNNIND